MNITKRTLETIQNQIFQLHDTCTENGYHQDIIEITRGDLLDIIKELETVEIDIADKLKLEDTSKAEIKCGANGDAFNFELSLVDVHKKGDGNKDENVFEYESDELSEWLQKIADMLDIKYPDEFNLKSIENAIEKIGESK